MIPKVSQVAGAPPPVAYVLTADLDWASEYCIAHFLGIARRFSIRPTLFVTHESATVREAEEAGLVELAIHPNFLPGSSHGTSPEAVIGHMLRLVPAARAVRCHRYFDTAPVEAALAARGLRVDSNSIRHLASEIAPEQRASGVLRLPVFFEDDVHWRHDNSWHFGEHAPAFFSGGLKILNFHPFFVALNVADAAFYEVHRGLIPTLTADQAARLANGGTGAGTFLVDALTAVRAAGHRFVTLGELVEDNPAWQAPATFA
jgi:hypothetical protein